MSDATAGRHVLLLTVDNKPGVLSRITGLFTRRGYNIESLITGPTEDGAVYHITVTMLGTADEVALLARQLARIMEVITIRTDLDKTKLYAVSERLLLKIRRPTGELPLPAGARVVASGDGAVAVEITGSEGELAAARDALAPYGILETLHSGAMLLPLD
ncbi:MAG: acetolactate synthase small subunit [Clostridia bacterium]|nr:acetolactate synthase small subunit [Clostridia bacterium]